MNNIFNYDIDTLKYLTKGGLAFGLVYAYDVFVDDRGNDYAALDGGTFALSTISTEVVADVLSSIWNMNAGALQGMITKPVFDYIERYGLYD